jgi:hypothetical protein
MSSLTLARLRRSTVAVSIAAGGLLGLGSLIIQPPFTGDPAQDAAALTATAASAIGIHLYTISQVFWAIGFIGLAHLASRRSPVLALLGGVLVALGVLGHTVYSGTALTQLALASSGEIDATVAAMDAAQSPVFLPYLALGLLGTTLGVVLLAVATMHARTMPLWVPVVLIAWVLIEFVLSGFIAWGGYLSLVVGIIVFCSLAVFVWRSALAGWQTAAEASVPAGEAARV